MTAPTHIAFAELVYMLLLTTAGVALNAANAFVIAAASVLADIDTGSSLLGRMLPAISLPIERTFGHRTLTHSALFVAGLAIGALPLVSVSKDLYACLVIGYATHPFLDTMNIGGVKLFYPFTSVRCVFPFDVNAPARFRTPTGSKIDRLLGALFLAGCIPTFVISEQGHERFIRMTQRTIESAVRDYNEFSVTHRVVAEISARNLFTKESIKGRYEIAGALDERTLLFRDEAGVPHSLGHDYEAEYTAETAVCYPVEPERTVVRHLEFENQPLGSLTAALDPRFHSSIFGELVMREPVHVAASAVPFSPVSAAGYVLKLRYASMRDIQRPDLARALVTRGSVTIRTEIPLATETPNTFPWSDSVGRFAILSLECRVGAALRLLAAVGDTVREGQILAEIRPDTLTMLTGELETAERAAAFIRQRSELASLDLRAAALTERTRADSLELVRLRQLQREGYVPERAFAGAELAWHQDLARLRNLEQRRLLLTQKMRIRSKSDALKPLTAPEATGGTLRSTTSGIIHDIQRSAQGKTIEVTVVIRRGSH
jgi:inner membrane protein